MIYGLYISSIGGVGTVYTNIPSKEEVASDILVLGFLSAVRAFGHEIYHELQFIQFVRSRIVFLPSQDVYCIAVHASNDHTPVDLLEYLEEIRDHVNESCWKELGNELFSNITHLNEIIINFNQECLKKRGW